MKQTLFVIPAWLFEGPVLVAWLILGLLIFAYLFWKHGFKQGSLSFLPVFAVVAAVIYFVLPRVMISGTNPEDPNGPLIPIGLAVRGYGLMMLLAIICGFVLVVVRANQCRLNTDKILSMSFWMIACGIIGARIFYVYQKYDQFQADTLSGMLVSMVDMTKGGLVVYGSLVGGLLAAFIYCWKTKLKFWLTGDVLIPGLLLGLAIGRIGCLMNGCCFGGPCDVSWVAVQFPAGSPPYMRQLETGELIGLKTVTENKKQQTRRVMYVKKGSLGEELGVRQGDVVRILQEEGQDRVFRDRIQHGMDIKSRVVLQSSRLPDQDIPVARFENPPLNESTPIHPTQVYSAVNAFLLAAIAWFIFPYRRRDGDAIIWMIMVYAVTRFLLERVRTDELPIDPFGWFTISQWVSIGMITVGFLILLAGRYRPPAESPHEAE